MIWLKYLFQNNALAPHRLRALLNAFFLYFASTLYTANNVRRNTPFNSFGAGRKVSANNPFVAVPVGGRVYVPTDQPTNALLMQEKRSPPCLYSQSITSTAICFFQHVDAFETRCFFRKRFEYLLHPMIRVGNQPFFEHAQKTDENGVPKTTLRWTASRGLVT